jgi:membrane protein DedA with SNARE-associated domain
MTTDTKEVVPPEICKPPRRSRWGMYLGIATVVVTIAACVLAIVYQEELMGIARLAGYSLLGVFLIALVAGSVFSFVAIPVPYWLLVFTLPTVLAGRWGIWAPILVGLTSAAGASLGHLPTFMIGYGGGKTFKSLARITRTDKQEDCERPGFYTRCINWSRRHGSWAVFVMSAIFNPLHLPMTIAIGALRYPPLKFLLFSFLGDAFKGLVLAFAGYFGLTSLLRLFGA